MKSNGFVLALAMLFIAVVTLSVARGAYADVGSMYGVGSSSVARAGQAVATPSDDAAVVHNVAALASTTTSVRLGFTGAVHALRLARQCQAGEACLAARAPSATRALTGGWAGKVHERVGLGVTFSTPASELVRITAPDPKRPHAPMLEGTADRFSLVAGAGVAVLPWLEVGIGLQVHARIASHVMLDLDPIHQTLDRTDVEIHLGPRIGATAGLRARGPGGTLWALSWRQAASVSYEIPARIGVDSVAAVDLRLAQLAHGTPQRVRFAAAITRATWTVEVGADWQRWSTRRGLGPDLSSNVGGPLVDGVGLGQVVDVNAPAAQWAPALEDTVSLAASGEWQARQELSLRAGWRYRPTPFPLASATAALVDSDAHVVAAGLSLQVGGWQFGAGGQVWLWQTRRPTSGSVTSHDAITLVSSLDITRRF